MNRNDRLSAMPQAAMAIAASVLFLLCAANAGAQASRVGATLEGIVSDTSGAVIPNAKVTLNNSLTNAFPTDPEAPRTIAARLPDIELLSCQDAVVEA